MKAKKKFLTSLLLLVMAVAVSGCSDDDETEVMQPTSLYAIIVPEGARIIDVLPEDYVMTLDNIIAVNPEKGEFKMKGTERIDSHAYPIPTQYCIHFYSNGEFLFDAKMNSSISSYLPSGLTFCQFLTDKNGLSRYDLGAVQFHQLDGSVEGELTSRQKTGMKRMYEILRKAGKVTSNIQYEFNF